MKSVMRHQFSEVPRVEIPRSTFDRSHGVKTTFDAGYLVPILIDEALPGDTFNVNLTGFARLATPVYPIIDNMRMETFFFAVPMRLVWENWQKFCGERVNPTDDNDYTIPIIDDAQNIQNETLYDYFGLPTGINAIYEFSALPFRAYNLIWNEWFRDENLQNSLTVNTDDGPDNAATYVLKRRGKRHDYFTSCLPWLQKGDAVELSLGTSAPVLGIGKVNQSYGETNVTVYEAGGTGSTQFPFASPASSDWKFEGTAASGVNPYIRADLANAVGPTVNELREAVQVQRILERDARSGTRYTEIVQSHFGVVSPDARLQRPEYLGGGSTPVHISPIANTSNTSTGKLAAMGTAAFSGHGFTKSFTEHCIIIGLVNVRADITYQEGLDRMWSRKSRFDFYWPSLAHLGEQAVLNKEIFVNAAAISAGSGPGGIDAVFGYQERFAEYRYKPSKITGKLRSNDAGSLDAWHLGIEFGSLPALGSTFIEDNPPIDRVIAVPTEPHFIYDSYIQMKCTRPMPVYSVPGLIDHF